MHTDTKGVGSIVLFTIRAYPCSSVAKSSAAAVTVAAVGVLGVAVALGLVAFVLLAVFALPLGALLPFLRLALAAGAVVALLRLLLLASAGLFAPRLFLAALGLFLRPFAVTARRLLAVLFVAVAPSKLLLRLCFTFGVLARLRLTFELRPRVRDLASLGLAVPLRLIALVLLAVFAVLSRLFGRLAADGRAGGLFAGTLLLGFLAGAGGLCVDATTAAGPVVAPRRIGQLAPVRVFALAAVFRVLAG